MGAWGYGDSPFIPHRIPGTDTLPGLLQSDHDFDIVENLTHEAAIDKLEEDAQAKAKAAGTPEVFHTIYGQMCSDRHAVRAHLESGVLATLIKENETKMIAGEEEKF
jgi:hypothetical protein